MITGVGAISAAGLTTPDLWSALLAAVPAITSPPPFDAARPTAVGQIADYNGPAGVPADFLARLDRSARLALDAAIQAVADSRIRFTAENAYQVAALIGSAHGPAPAAGAAFFSAGLAGSSTGLNVAGPAFRIDAGGASSLAAIQQAAAMIRRGDARAALAGGAEAPLRADVWAAYAAAGLLSSQSDPQAQRPFDLLRDGMVLGEGAAVLLLEDRQLAVMRGARIYAEIAGAAMTAGPAGDGAPPTDVDIARRALGAALRDANRGPQEIDCVFTAGASTRSGDARETDVLERSFGARILDMYVTAVSPVLGYTIGAAGALSAAAAAFTLAEQTLPPHATYAEPDPDCALDIARTPQRDHLDTAAVCAYGSVGQNAALILATHRAEPGDELPMA